MALAEEMSGWFKQMEQRNWAALEPQRDIGYKALHSIDRGLEEGRYMARPAAPPPSWRGTPSSTVAQPPGGSENYYPDEPPRPVGV